MSKVFTVRLKPLYGESLSGYILSVALANGIDFDEILKMVTIISHKIISKRNSPYIIDFSPFTKIDLRILASLTGITQDILEGMTFLNLYRKFTDIMDSKTCIKSGITKKRIIKDHRQFCPYCLREHSGFKLIWQISDIEICDVHSTKLISHCTECGRQQPYVSNKIAELKCTNCDTNLHQMEVSQIQNKEVVNEQLKFYKYWEFLLKPHLTLCNLIKGMSKEKSLIITFFYACQLGKKEFKLDSVIKLFHYKFAYELLECVYDRESPTHITQNRLFNMLRLISISIEEFSNINVPKEFIKSVMAYNDKILPGTCEFKLCSCYESSRMRRINYPGYHSTIYSRVFVCMGCHMQYGYNIKSKKWEFINNNALVISKVLTQLKQGMSRGEIVTKLALNYRTVSKAIGYIASHRLASYDVIKQYIPNNIPENISYCFQLLLEDSGRMSSSAKVMFDWSTNDYYYFVSLDNVQEHIIFDSYKFRKRKYMSPIELEQTVMKEIK